LNRAEELITPSLPSELQKTRNTPWGVCSTDSADKSVGDIRVTDPDSVALVCYTANDVADIDIVIARGQVGAGAIPQGGVVATGVLKSATLPQAVLLSLVFRVSALAPTAVLKVPSVLSKSAL
jgi:hypothetical protein